ncbi:MAG: hypothetical protein IBX55_21930 [Methyloprofundus sp.]|nr:hypothetical protein [Methyloprofundus sp.]
MKKILMVLFIVISLAGCGNDYSEANFSSFQRTAERNASSAIEELRLFIYHNPSHAESQLLIGELLVGNSNSKERELYLGQFYLKKAISNTENTELIAQAEDLILQAKLRRGMSPGDPEALINLANFAQKNGRYRRAVELYISASYELLLAEDLTRARDQARQALQITESKLVNKTAEVITWPREYEEALAILITVKIARGRFGDAKTYFEQLAKTSGIFNYKFDDLPDPVLMMTMVDSLDGVASRRFFSRRSANNVDKEQVLNNLINSEEENQEKINELRTLMSHKHWIQFRSNLDASQFNEIFIYATEIIEFYESRL